ncbi:MAG: phosphoenolpyruvate carboxylase [Thermomicrobiales bacterium]
MERSWPFFKGLLSNAEMAMAKADLRIAERYIDLVTDPIVRGQLWGKITSEYDRSVDLICRVRGERHLLDGDQIMHSGQSLAVIRTSIRCHSFRSS